LIEFELVVYIKTRTHENMNDFLSDFWTDESDFLNAELDFEKLFQNLAEQISWDKQYDQDFRISSVATLFKHTKTNFPKKEILKKYSYLEFLDRNNNSEDTKNSKRPFLSNIYKFGNFDLSDRKFKIIDYGNCYDYSDERYGLINTRQYRAPEVILSKPNPRLQRMV
jgi:hypothetical protein